MKRLDIAAKTVERLSLRRTNLRESTLIATSVSTSECQMNVYKLLSPHADRHGGVVSFTVCLFVRNFFVTHVSCLG